MTRLLAVVALLATLLSPLPLAAADAQANPDCLVELEGLDLQSGTVLDLQEALADGRITSRQLVQRYLDRIAAFDQSGAVAINSIRALNPMAIADAARLDAERRQGSVRGPLHGIPVLLKDNIGTKGLATTAGSIALEHNVPVRDAFVVAQLREAGAVILGKTNLSEFANWMALGMPNGYSSLGGQVRNPYDYGDPSGSSSGSGVAGTMAFATVAVGTETSGSILSPSQANSLVGIKPTLGLVSRDAIIPLAPSFDTAGPMTRNVTDAAALLGAMTGVDERDDATAGQQVPEGADYLPFLRPDALQGVRLGYSGNDRPSGDRGRVFDQALDDLRAAGAEMVRVDTHSYARFVGLTEIAAIPNEFKESLNRYLREATDPAAVPTRTLTEIIAFNRMHPDKVQYGQNLLEISDLTLGNRDEPTAIANRTAAIQASRAAIDATLIAHDLDAIVSTGNGNANVGAAAGYPSVGVPAGYTADGRRPQSISFLSTAYDEADLITYAYAYEQVSRRRVPPTVANPRLVASCG
jgi:amidase